jgi:hypothetical protein
MGCGEARRRRTEVTAVDVGLMIRYGRLVPGREAAAMELFDETVGFFQDRLARGELSFFEPFFLMTSDLDQEQGFFLVKGAAPAIFAMMEEEAYLEIMTRASLLVEHLHQDLLRVGEGIQVMMEESAKAQSKLLGV